MADRTFSRRRCFAWTLAIGAHVALLVSLSAPLELETPPVTFVDEAPARVDAERVTRVEVPTPSETASRVPAARRPAAPPLQRRPRSVVEDRDDVIGVQTSELAPSPLDGPVALPLSMLDDQGRAILPDEPLYSSAARAREGDWHTPGDGSEDDVFDRPLALDPATTRFERVWAQPESLGSEWYGRLMRATTGTVRVPLNPKFTLICGVSIAGLGGGCGIARVTGSGVVVERSGDPPPWERSGRVQCRELREQLAAAGDADRVAYLLDRLAALCSTPDGNEEARREAGLSEADEATGPGPEAGQRVAR